MSSPERFASLSALRSAHADLLRVTDDDPTPGDLDRVADFLRKAAATGAILDTPDDRKQAQGLIDYWAASLQSEYRDACRKLGPDALQIKTGDLVLNEFDAGSIRQLAEAAQDWLDGLPPETQDVARRVLMRLVTLTRGRAGSPRRRSLARTWSCWAVRRRSPGCWASWRGSG